MIDTLANLLEPSALFLLDTTIKTTLFMCIVLLSVWRIGVHHATKRNLLLSLSIVALLVIPLASILLPALQFRPKFQELSNSITLDTPSTLSMVSQSTPQNNNQNSESKTTAMPAVPSTQYLSDETVKLPPADVVFSPIKSSNMPINWQAWTLCILMLIYGIGVFICLVRLALGILQVWSFRRTSIPVRDGTQHTHFLAIKNELGIKRAVALVTNDHISSPTQIGILHPTVVLPTHLTASHSVLKSILVHELVHIKQWDCLYRLLAMVAGSIYWFNPVFHRMNQLLAEVQEQSCDDWTINLTGNSHEYASTLLNVATQSPRPTVTMGLAMAQTTNVQNRIDRIITLGGRVTPQVSALSALLLATVLIGGATAIGSTTLSKDPKIVNHITFEGGVTITDTSNVIQTTRPKKMRDGRFWWPGTDGIYLQDNTSWQKFTLPKGGGFDYVRTFLQTKDGSVWFSATYKRKPLIARFDGKTWQTWDHKDGIVGVSALGYKFSEDTNGGIWIAAGDRGNITDKGGSNRTKGGNGVMHFDGKLWHNYRVEDGLIHNRVYNVEADLNGGMWVATLRGLSHHKDGKWTSHLVDDIPVEDLRNNNPYEGRKVYKVFYDQQGTLWTLHGSGIGRTITRQISGISSFDGQTWTHYDAHTGCPALSARYLWQTEDGAMWFGTHKDDQKVVESKGLLRYKNGMWLRLTQKHGIKGPHVWGLAEKEHGSFYLNSKGMASYTPPLDDLATISGRVINKKSGQPASQMGIWVEYDDGEVHAGTMTNQSGRYTVQVTPGLYRVRIASKNAAEPVAVDATTKANIEDIDLMLLTTHRISGLVVDTNQKPVVNAVVVISDDSANDNRLSPQVVTTNTHGRFEAWQVTGPQATLEVAATGYAQKQVDHDFTIEQRALIILNKGMTLQGRLIDQHGSPLAWARIESGQKKLGTAKTFITNPFRRNTYTNQNGLFMINDVSVNGTLLSIDHPETGIIYQDAVPQNQTVAIQIQRSQTFSISGVVSLNEESVEDLEVRALASKRPWGPFRPQIDRTDKDGFYELKDLEPGRYQISVSRQVETEFSGHKFTRPQVIQSRIITVKKKNATLNFEPLGDARLTGIVTHMGKPISDVNVSAIVLEQKGLLSAGTVQTDKEGKYELENLPSAKIMVSFHRRQQPGREKIKRQWSKTDSINFEHTKNITLDVEMNLKETTELFVGNKAPNISTKRLDGSTFNLADYQGKKAVLIDFLATWCPPCIDEIPNIKKIAEFYGGQDLEVVGISLDKELKALADFVEKENLDYPQIFDKTKTISKSFGVWGIPATFLIDKNGTIRAKQLRGAKTEEAVKDLLSYIKQQSIDE